MKSLPRRDFLRIGGASLCGVSLLDVLRAQSQAAGAPAPKAKQMIVCWMAGGPPHTDMFDMKPDSGTDYKGEFRPIKTNLPGLDVCELMPSLAKVADKYTVIRSITTSGTTPDGASHQGGTSIFQRHKPAPSEVGAAITKPPSPRTSTDGATLPS